MDFVKAMKQYQYERHMTNEAFSKYLGKSRAWLQRIYSRNPKIEKSTLSELTMYMINEKLEISFEVMEEYNKMVLGNRSEEQ